MKDTNAEMRTILRRIKKCHRRIKSRPEIALEESRRLERLKARYRKLQEQVVREAVFPDEE
jgi:hypothetical protein